MIYEIKGDLLKSDCTVIAHQCNCMSNMGKGIAKVIANIYPEAQIADTTYKRTKLERLGTCSVAKATNEARFIVNLYAQAYPGKAKSEDEQEKRYLHLEQAVENMLKSLPTLRKKGFSVKVGLPYLMGCDLAGGTWSVVEEILKKLSEKYGEDIYIYNLEKKIRN